VARVDLKADRKAQKLNVLSMLLEETASTGKDKSSTLRAVKTALRRYARALSLELTGIKSS
jgi:uncharacterized protein YcaQ